MARTQKSVDENTINSIQKDLNSIKHSELVIKLRAIKACYDNKIIEVAKIFGVGYSTLQGWIKSYSERGVNGLINKPKGHNPSKLSVEEEAQIKEWILSSTTNEGEFIHWTLYKLKAEIKRVFGKQVGKSPLWQRLKKMNLSPRRPRPEHKQADKAKQEDFKKNSRIN
jgi:transposase